jgi:hypothetical protein
MIAEEGKLKDAIRHLIGELKPVIINIDAEKLAEHIKRDRKRFHLALSESELEDLMFGCRAAMEKVNWYTKNRTRNVDLRGSASKMIERQVTLLKLLEAVKNSGQSSTH